MTDFSRIIDAVCWQLNDQKVGFWPGANAPYPKKPPLPPVYAKRLQATSGSCLAVSVYDYSAPQPGSATITARVQIRTRAPYTADPLADQALNALHGAHHQEWHGLRVERCIHTSTAQLGIDEAGLDERTDNYEITTTI